MKRCIVWSAALLALAASAYAEPITFEQAANVTGLGGVEVGFDVDYAYTKFSQGDLTLAEQTKTDIPVFVRVGIPVLELKVTAPYGSVKTTVQDALASEEQSFNGFRNVGVMVKTSLLSLPMLSLGLGLDTLFPNTDALQYVREGLKVNPFVAAGVDLSFVKLNANLGFQYRGEFTLRPEMDDSGITLVPETSLKPGDAFTYAVGVEIPAGDVFSVLAEVRGAGYSEAKATVDGTSIAVPNSAGATMTLVPGVRAKMGPVKAKLGVEIPVTRNEDFKLTQNAPQADWRVIAGASLQFSL